MECRREYGRGREGGIEGDEGRREGGCEGGRDGASERRRDEER